MTTVRIAPSLLACDLGRVRDEVADVTAAGADLLHFDVMDNRFVPNLSFGPPLCRAVRGLTDLHLAVHLMVVHPEELIDPFADAGADSLIVHVEAAEHLHRTLSSIRDRGMRPGVAVNPATPVASLDEIWPFVDTLLVMTVNPGFGGQEYIAEMDHKLERLVALRAERNPRVDIAVDGGVNAETAPPLRRLGIDVLVAGTAVFGSDDRRRAIATLRGENG